jgi:hypothetical protein
MPLTRVLTLKSGRRLETLLDAADFLTERLRDVPQDPFLKHALELLLRAVQTGALADRRAATKQVALVLRLTVTA